jgi:ADP-ribosylglycohydrolase
MPADAVVGAILGDIVGSVHESAWRKVPDRDFPFLTDRSHFTDDTVLTIAVAEAVRLDLDFAEPIALWANRYPHAGYGGGFRRWMASDDRRPYGSFGNGSAMRVSAVAYTSDDLEVVLPLAAKSAAVTHSHPEGIRGAQAIAGAVLIARLGGSKDNIRDLVARRFTYDLSYSVDEWRDESNFDVTCQGTVPAAVQAFLEGDGVESTIRNAVYIGGDSDTLAAIAGSIAGAAYGVAPELRSVATARLDEYLRAELDAFEGWGRNSDGRAP